MVIYKRSQSKDFMKTNVDRHDFSLYCFLSSVLSSSVLKGNIIHKNRYHQRISGKEEDLRWGSTQKILVDEGFSLVVNSLDFILFS